MSVLDKPAINSMIPHAGNMCLLDAVEHWEQDRIICTSTSHHYDDNPLREAGQLNAVALVEYAAQAAAVHAALVGAGIGGNRTALLGAVKGLKLHCQAVDPSHTRLMVSARNVLQSNDGAIYQVVVQAGEIILIEARLVLMIP